MWRKVFFIVLSVLLMVFGISYMAVVHFRDSQKSFVRAGYILDNKSTSSSNKSNVYYFDEDTSYKTRYDSNVVFTDTNGDKVDVVEASFIHYNDDSIGVLKKAVILNLEEINAEIPKYYNIFTDTILQYGNGSYSVDNLGKPLKFSSFIVKVSDTKYLIISNDLKLNLDGTKDIPVTSKYIELNFVDEKVVTIENKDVKYQTIGKDAIIDLGNHLTLNLDNRYIFYDDDAKISIDQMIIDSSDNIEIQPIDEEKKDEEEQAEEDNANQNNGNGGVGDGSSDGGEEDTGDSIGGNVIENEVVESELQLPTADISELEVTANKIEGTIHITDKDSLITSGATTSIIENSTGRVVDLIESDEGTYNIEISSNKLMPDTIYNLVTTLSYKKNDVIYTMDIVQNVFSTSALGVSLRKDYFTSDSLNYYIHFDTYSKVRSCNVSIYDTLGEVIETIPVEKSGTDVPVSFTGLKSNTKYSILVDNILYDDYIVSNDYAIETSAKTLKVRPNIGTPSFILDKKNGKFTLKLDNMVDSENGVESYRYAVYDTRTMDAGTGSPITIIEKNNLSSVDLNVDDSLFYRGVGYVFQVVIDFYDNEKYIEYFTTMSGVMQLDGREAPSISWKTNNVTFEMIDGIITVTDTGNTIDLDKPMTIVYTNSSGTTEQYTAAGNTVIPFNRNNLRANETYTISLYGTVNLQDGNPAIDNYHIGSVSVNTLPTNPFNVSFTIDTDDIGPAFNVKARLLNDGIADNRLEASTLTGISFVLHEGSSISGKVVKTIHSVDRDLREYFSDLQVAYYDKEFVLNPAFFGLNNPDLNAEYYTIEIKDAYDYTVFKNQIGINNSFITVKSNDFMPDIPKDPDDAITFETVRNKDAEEINTSLDATTIVGMKVKANYDNSRRNARVIKYKVYDANDCETDENGKKQCRELTDLAFDYVVPDNGLIDFSYIPIGNGTPHSVVDNDARRGHVYYVTYIAMLDLNNDGEAETRYPAKTDVVLRSKNIEVSKQDPKITMYPFKTSSGSMSVKYTYVDVDNTVYDRKFHAVLDTSDPFNTEMDVSDVMPITINQTTETVATFNNLRPGLMGIYVFNEKIKNSTITAVPCVKEVFYNPYTLPNLTYHLEVDVNRLVVTFDNYEARASDYGKIAALNMEFISTDSAGRPKTIKKEFVRIENGSAIVDLFDLSDFIGKDIQLKIDALYDSSTIEYNTSGYVAFQNIENEYGGGEYYTVSSKGSIFYDSLVAKESVFKLQVSGNKYVLTSMISNQSFEVEHKPDQGGMVYNYTHVIPKKLSSVTLQPSSAQYNTFKFTQVVPGISVLDTTGESRIVPLMTNVSVGASLYGFDRGIIDIRDSKIYIHVYKTNESGADLEELLVKETDVDSFTQSVVVDGLYPDTSYALRFYAFVNDGEGNYIERQLYDVDENNPAKTYYFNTLSGVEFSDFYYTYTPTSYSSKKLNFYYTMSRTMGFDKVRYVFSERKLDELTGQYYFVPVENLVVADDPGLQSNMKLQIDVSPGTTGFVFGNYYRLEVIPIVYATVDGERVEVELSNDGGIYNFNLRSLKSPYVGVKGSYTADYTSNKNVIVFTTNIYDSSRVVVGDKYTIQVLDDNDRDITPDAYRGYEASTRRYNVQYRVPDLEVGHIYRFLVKYTVDMKNDIDSAEDKVYSYEINLLSSDEVNVGTINAVQDSIYPNRVDLQFMYSYRLTAIDTLNYSIYNSEDGSSIDGSIDFEPSVTTISGETVYIQKIPDTLPSFGLYYIQTQFLFGGKVVYDGGLDYTYVSG